MSKSPFQRMALFWQLMNRGQRYGLAMMAGLQPETGEKGWHDMTPEETKGLITAIRSAGTVCEVIHDDTMGIPA